MKIPGLRWWIAAMLFGAAVLNYVDRQTLSLLVPTIQHDLGMNDEAYANVVNCFLAAYVISYLFSGKLVDKLGTRLAYSLFVGWWSISNMLMGFARSAFSLGIFSSMLGLGEAGNWTASPKAVSEWFPARERALAIGIYTMGGTVGATLAPLLIVPIGTIYGWPSAFLATGLLGLLWLIPWLWIYRLPEEHPRITEVERKLVLDAREEKVVTTEVDQRWGTLLRQKEVWVLMLARMLTDPVWYFYQFWFAKYLFTERGLSQKELTVTWVIFFAADIGSLMGGWFSGQLIRRGKSPIGSRMLTMLGCAVAMPLAPLVVFSSSTQLSLLFAMLMVFAHLAWLINLSSLILDVFPQPVLGTVFGVVAAGSALGGIAMNKFVAWLVSHHSYADWFLITTCLHPAAWLLLRATGLTPYRATATNL